MAKIALVLGATGMVGKALIEELLSGGGWEEVRVLVRRTLPLNDPRLTQTVIDWERLEDYGDSFSGVTEVFCCLGTTIKKAGSQEQFEKVDLQYPLAAARLARAKGARQFLAVSSMGASASSRNFYLRTKGNMEEGVMNAGYPAVHLFRPSLLLGEREEFRLGERVSAVAMKGLDKLFARFLARYRAVPAATVARAMANIARAGTGGTHVYPNDVLFALGGR
ncbi:NAD(P)H-binding protein [Paenibacillus sp. NFR01]|uniref:NAD(P)H-binding protein n=1 Tax=Paenibacillus sp. NFR01 TaxID=1566279 RepID=UPI0008B2AA03|nr:NAD(P)H-binding protein [Paenibacillus sp. NFR01]SEU29811.1 Uncharacterized conserved protein YbjT, contains NAD(P)-binding and DUF2867 domains [Paenibacillus sp. NFR01]